MRQPLSIQRWFWRPLSCLPAPGRSATNSSDGPRGDLPHPDARFLAQLHPLHRRFLAYRRGLDDGRSHSIEETAAHFAIDPATARLTERYLRERYRLHLDRIGWRASQTNPR